MLAVPFKANVAWRCRIPNQRYRVTDWAVYDAALFRQEVAAAVSDEERDWCAARICGRSVEAVPRQAVITLAAR
jgi:hypothetical protein